MNLCTFWMEKKKNNQFCLSFFKDDCIWCLQTKSIRRNSIQITLPVPKSWENLALFSYTDHLLFKEGMERLKHLKSFMSCHGKFYTNTCVWWAHVVCTQLLSVSFSHSCPFHPISHLRKPCSWVLSLQTSWIKLSIGQRALQWPKSPSFPISTD